jgi:hypothetical protein
MQNRMQNSEQIALLLQSQLIVIVDFAFFETFIVYYLIEVESFFAYIVLSVNDKRNIAVLIKRSSRFFILLKHLLFDGSRLIYCVLF